MDKILIIGCKKAMDDVCIGCSRCMVGFNRRAGAFADYGPDAQLIGMLNCGDCPGATIVTRLAQLKFWNMDLDEQPTAIHLGPCLVDHCPYKDHIVGKIRAKSGVKVVEGTHPYLPKDIFA